MRPIIEVKGLSKRYKLGVFNAKTLREEAEAFLARFGRKKAELAGGGQKLAVGSSQLAANGTASAPDEFWALKDVSFDVQPGEVIGVIGRNGAGKSTLLKILSRITEPTSGEARIRGRVASLLEVGTGFHPELTGRENIFLNGAILGMTKAEIRSKFDEIVAFAEIEKFIDTPVKRYSSGMYVRLAFAVAAHLEPEVLIVDEVLAVGDAEFQSKCLGKMQNVASAGRTVLFVSHNMAAVRSLCGRGVLLENGSLKMTGSIDECVRVYLSKQHDASELSFGNLKTVDPVFERASLTHTNLDYGQSLDLQLSIRTTRREKVAVEMEIHDERGRAVLYTSTAPLMGEYLEVLPEAENRFRLEVGPLNLAVGNYSLFLWLTKPWVRQFHVPQEPLKFQIQSAVPFARDFDFLQSYGRGCFTCATKIHLIS